MSASIFTSNSSSPAPVIAETKAVSTPRPLESVNALSSSFAQPIDLVQHVQTRAILDAQLAQNSSAPRRPARHGADWKCPSHAESAPLPAPLRASRETPRSRSGGRSRRNPTVSDRSTRRREGKRIARIVGSSVANIFEDVSTLGVRQRVEERRFARVRVSHERDHSERHRLPRPPARGALPANRFDGLLDFAARDRGSAAGRFRASARRDRASRFRRRAARALRRVP